MPSLQLLGENLNGRFGRIFNDVLYAFHPPLNPPETVLSKEEWQQDWQNDEFLESDTDMACVHSVPVFDAYHDRLVSVEKGALPGHARRSSGSSGT